MSEGVSVQERVKQFQKATAGKPTSPSSSVKERTAQHVPLKGQSVGNDSELFKEPAELIFTDEQTGKLRCNEKTLKLLSEINQPLNVIGITGLYRSGKSYLMNRLAGGKNGFKTGNKTHGCTKGIWILCRQHPKHEEHVLVLLDVEGFGDIDKVNRKEDTWLFTLATLLCSTMVYNNKGPIDASSLDRLKFLEEIDITIQVSEHEEEKKLLDFDFFFPTFVITLRDFHLQITDQDDQPNTPDEYVEGILRQKRGSGRDLEDHNRIRLLIRRYFKKRKCFAFITPCGPKVNLEIAHDRELEPDFQKSVQEFSDFVFGCEPLQLRSGKLISGRMFSNLALHYVTAIGQNRQPSILEATKYMVETENHAAVAAASDVYKKQMQKCIANLGSMNPSDESLVGFHEQCLEKALSYFKLAVVFDDKDIFQKEAMRVCSGLLARFKRTCDENSVRSCNEAITRLNMRIEKKLREGTYCCESGYDEYMQDINWLVKKYTNISGLGAKSKAILQAYLDGKEEESESVSRQAARAQQDASDKKPVEDSQYQRSTVADLATKVSKSNSFRQSLAHKAVEMEDRVYRELEQQQALGKKKLHESYVGYLDLRIRELEQQRRETFDDAAALIDVEDQIAYVQKIRDYAKDIGEGNDGTVRENIGQWDGKKAEKHIGEGNDGTETGAPGFFQENSGKLERKKAEKKSLCKVQ